MENSFLENLGRYITEFYGDDTGRLCVVLPNKRAGLFLERALSSLLESPSWSPEVFSVEELINDISGLTPADQAEQLVLFYSVYKKAEKEKAEPFELFSKWAPTLLNDFNEADMYLADTEKLFGNLAEIKSIENWSLGAEELTEFQKEYVRFWSNIGRWHRVYRDLLLREKKAYPGMMYRHVADNIAQLFPQGKWKKIIFAGFNALSAAEEKIISVLRQNRQADVLWDADRYYLEDPMQEAGKFLRAHREHLFRPLPGETASFTHVSDHFLSDEKKITVIGAAKNVSQARAAGWFLQTIPEGERFTPSTAIVLADEQLLFPVLSALPAGDDPVNITMGFPMKNSGAALFFSALFSLHETAQRFGITSRKGNRKYYHEDVIRLLKHPYTKELFPGSRFTAELENMIRRMNLIFLSVEQLDLLNGFEDEKQIFSVFFEPWENGHDALSRTEAIIFLLQNAFSGEQEEKMNTEREYLFRVHVMLNRVRSLADRLGDENSIHTTRAFFEQQMNSATLPFSGEPLGGLQIMGLLETRTLDFRNVILLSANENILPAGKSQQSFIVHDLRRAFGLPLWNEKDAVTAYHF
ncbi:MAG TPA: hypothetical protein VFU15_00135, partial [Bacteroidia bacterium]|nr:hypothetical protein [Bacteroidia bacterium]